MPAIKEKTCKVCKKPSGIRIYCGEVCRNKGLKRPPRPSCKVLMDAMTKHKNGRETNWSAVGKQFGTSSCTAHIWAEQYGLIPVKFYLGTVFY